jgi:hypothetical protein
MIISTLASIQIQMAMYLAFMMDVDVRLRQVFDITWGSHFPWFGLAPEPHGKATRSECLPSHENTRPGKTQLQSLDTSRRVLFQSLAGEQKRERWNTVARRVQIQLGTVTSSRTTHSQRRNSY